MFARSSPVYMRVSKWFRSAKTHGTRSHTLLWMNPLPQEAAGLSIVLPVFVPGVLNPPVLVIPNGPGRERFVIYAEVSTVSGAFVACKKMWSVPPLIGYVEHQKIQPD
jgi:hypothetical protein